MSLNPSNGISEQTTGHKAFPNLARKVDTWRASTDEPILVANASEIFTEVDRATAAELAAAGITVEGGDWCRMACNGTHNEVPTRNIGILHGWIFKRAWYYWIAEGPGIPPDDATALHEAHGTSVRVAGHCGCPSPLEWFKGFAVGSYHVDNPEGLKALADTIRAVRARGPQ